MTFLITTMIHVLPNNEKYLHEESTTCQCSPTVNTEDEIIVVHNRLIKFRSSESIINEDENNLTPKTLTP